MKNQKFSFSAFANANDPYSRRDSLDILNFSRGLRPANLEITRRDSVQSQPKAKIVARNSKAPTTNHSSPKRMRRFRNANHFYLQCDYSLFSIQRRIERGQAQEDRHKFEYSSELIHKNHEIKAEKQRKSFVHLISILQLLFINTNKKNFEYLDNRTLRVY